MCTIIETSYFPPFPSPLHLSSPFTFPPLPLSFLLHPLPLPSPLLPPFLPHLSSPPSSLPHLPPSLPSLSVSPVINSIYSTRPVTCDSFDCSVPLTYVGPVLTCSAFAWPLPEVRWEREDGTLPTGVVVDYTVASGISAQMRWNEGFSGAHTGRYRCLVTWPTDTSRTISQTFTINEGTSTPDLTPTPPTCDVSSSSIFFQIRVGTENCDSWDSTLRGNIIASFRAEVFRIVEIETEGNGMCGCDVTPGNLQIVSLQCSANVAGGVVFRGTITSDTQLQTKQIFCSLSTWQQAAPLVTVNSETVTVDAGCSLEIDSYSSRECSAGGGTAIDRKLIIIVAAAVGGVILVVVVIFVICCCSRCCTRGKKRQTEDAYR